MEMQVYGVLHGVVECDRIISIKNRRKVNYYYMTKSMFRNFMMYFNPGIYVFLVVSKNARKYKGYMVQNVIQIDKVISPNQNKPKIYYDISIIKSGIKSIVNEKTNKLFIDFEMSMPPYQDYENFISEIIQVGYVLTDDSNKVIERFSSYIKPELFPQISRRTIKFLNIEQAEIETGITYLDFYHRLRNINYKYRPTTYVWGKNDQLELNKLNKIHKLNNFTKRMRFLDLLNLHKVYYGLKNDIGLFNAYNLYTNEKLESQKHDALEDAMVTREVFKNFVEVCNNRLQITLPNN